MSQDNNLTNVYFGIEGIADTAFSGSVANYPYIKSTSALQIATSSSPTALFDYNGDISFYEDTGTTPKFFWDASAESLGIGTSPNTALQVSSAVTTKSVVETTGASSDALIEFTRGQGSGNTWSIGLDQSNSSALSFAYLASGSPSLTSHGKVTIDTSGNVGIGTTDTNSHRAAIDSGAGTSLGLMHKSSNSFSLMTFKASGTTQDVRLGVTGNDLLFQTNATAVLSKQQEPTGLYY
jgi:hypothetical protein